MLGETEGDVDGLKDTEILGETEGLILGEILALGD